MNKFTFISLLILVGLFIYVIPAKGQCNCEKINRSDGTQVTQCQTLPVAYDDNTQVGLAAASNGQENFVSVVVRFRSAAKKLADNLSIRLENNNMLTLSIVNSQLAYIGNSETGQGIYVLNDSDASKFQESALKTISFKLEDGMLRTYQVRGNGDILKKQIRCL